MTTKHIYWIIFTLFLTACTPNDEVVLDMGYSLDKVVCQANSNYFVADGVSEMGLEVKLYTKAGTYTDYNGEEQTKYMEIPKTRWKKHDIKFFDRSGKEYAPDFKSTTLTPGVMEFYAEVDGIRSSKPILQCFMEHPSADRSSTPIAVEPEPVFFKMNVRAADPVPATKRYPVIFHIIDIQANKDASQELNSDAVYYLIDLWNDVFTRKNTHASNGGNPNIVFVPAVRDPNGVILTEPGINRQYFEGDGLKSGGDIYSNQSLYWDVDKYLNIWVIADEVMSTSDADNEDLLTFALPFCFPTGEYDATAFPLPTSTVTVKEMTTDEITQWKALPNNLMNVGIVFEKQGFPNYDPGCKEMGAFLGVIINTYINDTYGTPEVHIDDYCDDTPTWNSWFQDADDGGFEESEYGSSRLKYTAGADNNPAAPWLIYQAVNVCETDGFHSVITQDQARRIEYALQHAVARQAWRNSYAIDPEQ